MVEAEGNPTTWKFTQYVPSSMLVISVSALSLADAVLATLLESLWEPH
jgi:hypothetical protein